MELKSIQTIDQANAIRTPCVYMENDTLCVKEKPSLLKPFRLFLDFIHNRDSSPQQALSSLYSFACTAEGEQKQASLVLFKKVLEKRAKKLKISPSNARLINDLVQSRINGKERLFTNKTYLQSKVVSSLNTLRNNLPPQSDLKKCVTSISEDLSTYKTWTDLGLDPVLFHTDKEAARFLVKERLIYSIVGFQRTSAFGKHQTLRLIDGKIHILVNSKYTPVSELIGKFVYDKAELQFVHQETKKTWNYLGTTGLTEIDRCTSKEFVPVTKLSSTEMKKLLLHANHFPHPRHGKKPTCVLQIVTNPRRAPRVPNTTLLQGIDFLTPVHVSFRLIDQKGNVYSSGFASTAQEDKYNEGRRNKLATINGMPGILDYEELRQHSGRLVTSIPLTREKFETELTEVKKMRNKTVRFNIVSQNCSAMAAEVLHHAGIDLDNRLFLGELAHIALPSIANYPLFQAIIQKCLSLREAIARKTALLEKTASVYATARKALFTPFRILAQFLTNIVLLALGAARHSPVQEGSYEGVYLHPMKAGINSFKEMFTAKPTIIPHCGPFIKWQLAQKTTEVYKYTGPKLDILPQRKKDRGPLPAHLRPYTNLRFKTRVKN